MLRRFVDKMILDRRALREALKASEELLGATFEHETVGIVHLLLNGKLLRANRRFCAMLGYQQEAMRHLNMADLTHPEDRAIFRANLADAHSGALTSYTQEKRCYRKDGVTLWVEAHASLVTSKNSPPYVVAMIQDITQRRATIQSITQAKNRAEAASRMKSAFLANMSHEIRTPLNAILGFSDILIEPGLCDDDRAKFAATIRRNGHLLAKLIDDILDLSKVEAGKLETEMLSFSVAGVIYDVTSILGRQAEEGGIKLTTQIDGEIPERMTSDPVRLRQILINVIGNAIKFTKHGEINLTLRHLVAADAATPDRMAFIVTDTGRGIPSDEQATLFRAFSPDEALNTRSFGGNGLGLVLARRLAELLGGTVELTSSVPGRGSVFTVTVATGRADGVSMMRTISLVDLADRAKIPMGPNKGRLQGIKVLLAEDAPDNQMLIRRILDGNGATVDVASDGLEVLTKAWATDYDIILMDLQMPRLDGYDATESLRRQGYRKPIIALTAHAMKEERERALKAGVNDHLTKPVSQNHLVITVEQYSHASH